MYVVLFNDEKVNSIARQCPLTVSIEIYCDPTCFPHITKCTPPLLHHCLCLSLTLF